MTTTVQQQQQASKILTDIGQGVAKLVHDSADTKAALTELMARISHLEQLVNSLSLTGASQSGDKKGGRNDKKVTDQSLEKIVASLLSAKKVTKGYAAWALLIVILPELNKYPAYVPRWIYKHVVQLLVDILVRTTLPAIASKAKHEELYNEILKAERKNIADAGVTTPEQALAVMTNKLRNMFNIDVSKSLEDQKNEVCKLLDEIKTFFKNHDIKQFGSDFKTSVDQLYEFIKAENAKHLLQTGEVKVHDPSLTTMATTQTTASPFESIPTTLTTGTPVTAIPFSLPTSISSHAVKV